MLDILKKIFIGVCIGMSIFFLKTEVFALSWDLTQQSEFFIFNSAKTIYTIVPKNNGYTYSSSTFDTSFTNTNGYNFMVIPITFELSVNEVNQFNEDSSQYNGYSESLIEFIPRIVLISDGDWSTCELQNNFLVCPILKDVTYSSIRVYYVGGLSQYSFKFILSNAASLQNISFSSAIEQQTDDILDSDATASKEYNNDYSTDTYDSSSASVNQHTDTDVSSLSLDSSNYSSSWSWLWSILDSFIANTKVFLAYIFMLTLGFIALVLGR